MNKFYTLALAVIASIGLATASQQFDFSSAVAAGWTVNPAPNGYDASRGMQMTANTTLTLPNVQDVSSVVINGASNIDNYTVQVKVGSTSFGTKTIPNGNDQTWTFTGTAISGDLTIIVTKSTKKSLYIKTITIDGTAEVAEDTTSQVLDPNYTYAEPTIVSNSDSLGSNRRYEFVSNNILVQVTTGAQLSSYFGVNANNSITFTATRPMKAIVVNGLIKKDFEAEASAGEIIYADADEGDFEAEQVLAVTDIDTTVLTIACEKQMRCYSVSVYFEANPDSIDIEPATSIYSYDWEPTDTTSLQITFDSLTVTPMTDLLGYACTGLYFMHDEYEMELSVFVDVDSLTVLPLGTYPIDSTYAEGTVMASPGGDDYYDYPSYLTTGFYQDTDGEWYYSIVYYLVAGNLEVKALEQGVGFELHATTYNGSTIDATYTIGEGEVIEDSVANTTTMAPATKSLKNGQLLIRHNGADYTVLGQRL